ncbi:hypothetical protein GVV04_07220 [Micromonospora sp. NEAU-HG-1]|nr:hypothetical protein [Micromonospora rubida]
MLDRPGRLTTPLKRDAVTGELRPAGWDEADGAYARARRTLAGPGGAPTVASPLHRRAYELRTGACLDLPGVSVARHDGRCRDVLVEARLRREG